MTVFAFDVRGDRIKHIWQYATRQALALDDRLTRAAMPSGPLRAAATPPPLPFQAGPGHHGPARLGASPQPEPQPDNNAGT